MLATHLLKILGCDLRWGIDGELKSKFGEWSEKFWQSGSVNEKIRAIYFASGEGGSGGGGKKLEDLRGENGQQMISTGSGDNVQALFNFCVGESNDNGCKNAPGGSVVLVGDDPEVNASMNWEKLSSHDWGNQTSLVQSGYEYQNLFNKNIWKGNDKGERSSLNRQKVQNILTHPRGDDWMRDIMCPWIWGADQPGLRLLKDRCNNFRTGSASLESFSLIKFLKSDEARKYFKAEAWDWMGRGWEFLALLTLLDLWSGALRNVYFDRAVRIFEKEVDKFKLSSLMNSDGKILYWKSAAQSDELDSISYHSGGMWTVRLCSNSNGCSNDEGLNLTMGDGMFCISDFICLDQQLNGKKFTELKSKMNQISLNGSGTWTMVFGSGSGRDHLGRLLVALVVACFKDIERVSLSVQKPSEEEKVIFKLM